MIFRETYRAVLDRSKTQTRRPAAFGQGLRRFDDGTKAIYNQLSKRAVYSVGRDYAVQAGGDRPALGRIRISDLREQLLQDISVADAIAEGFGPQETALLRFVRAWQSMYAGGRYDWGRNPRVFVVEFELIMSHDHV